MRYLLIAALIASGGCTLGVAHAQTEDDTKNVEIQPNPVSAPSMRLLLEKDGVAQSLRAGDAKRPTVTVTDLKLRLTMPNTEWQVSMTDMGLRMVNPKRSAIVFLVAHDDMRPLEKIATDERAQLDKVEGAKATKVTSLKKPDRATFDVKFTLPDGRKSTMRFMAQRSPSEPKKRTVAFLGGWTGGDAEARRQVLAIIGSLEALP